MFNFTSIKNAITDDLRPICINNYLILNEINILPKELINEIIYYTFITTDEIIKLEQDIIYLEKDSLYQLIYFCYPLRGTFSQTENINILSPEYNKYLNLDSKYFCRVPLSKAWNKYNKILIKCVEKLYSLNNDIFNILFKRYYDLNNSRGRIYIEDYESNVKSYINKMKISSKYSSLLSIKTNF